jgi:hypothetical protein
MVEESSLGAGLLMAPPERGARGPMLSLGPGFLALNERNSAMTAEALG